MRYIKKPIPIEAFRYAVEYPYPEWFNEAVYNGEVDFANGIIHTIDGDFNFNPGDYIVQGTHKEIYPCKADIFQESYERYIE